MLAEPAGAAGHVTACDLCDHMDSDPALPNAQLDLRRCRGCGHVFLVRSARPEAAEYYADYYDGRNSTVDAITQARAREMLRGFERWVRPGRLLDVGCGIGYLMEAGAESGWDPVGVEISDAAVEVARARGCQVHHGDYLDIPFDAGSFDAITMIEVLEHLDRPAQYLRKAARDLRPGGLLYLTTPNFAGLGRRLSAGAHRIISTEHLNYFSQRTLTRVLDASGFRVVKVRTPNIDLPEVLRARRRAQNAPIEPPTDTPGGLPGVMRDSSQMRATIESRAALRAAKHVLNFALSACSLGDTLKVWAIRR